MCTLLQPVLHGAHAAEAGPRVSHALRRHAGRAARCREANPYRCVIQHVDSRGATLVWGIRARSARCVPPLPSALFQQCAML